MPQETPDPEIKVTDRRRFSSTGESLDAAEQEVPLEDVTADIAAEPPPLPPPTFEFLVLSFRLQAEMQLGMYRSEKEEHPAVDLEGARHTIDMLAVLQEKTRGNLTLEEQRLLENSLTELRYRYIQTADRIEKKS